MTCPFCGAEVIVARSMAGVTILLEPPEVKAEDGNGRAVFLLEDGLVLHMRKKDKRLGHRAHLCQKGATTDARKDPVPGDGGRDALRDPDSRRRSVHRPAR